MLILVLTLALVRFNSEGAPVDTSSIPQCRCDAVDLYLRDKPINSHFGTRARNDIIVGCLATILACTWTSIHPNIPAPGESGWNQLKQRAVTWIYALLAPEAITAWAMRQYFGAQSIASVYNRSFTNEISMSVNFEYENQWSHSLLEQLLKKRNLWQKIRHYVLEWMHGSPLSGRLEEGEIRPWTLTHGFFLQMGGYMLCENGKPVSSYKSYLHFEHHIKEERIDAPAITEAEIQDRSKGDVLSKTIVILQTTWFIAQCIARWLAHLPVTELEVVTLGYAMLNALTYAFWWNKPQSVGIPVFLETKTLFSAEVKLLGGEETDQTDISREHSMVALETCASVESEARERRGEERKTGWRMMWKGFNGIWCRLRGTRAAEVPRKALPMKQRSFSIRQLAEDTKHPQWQLVWRTPYALVLAVLRPLAKLLQFTETDWDKWDLRVPMFRTEGGKNETAFVASSIIASLFGLVHFIPAWFLEFPSSSEMLLWRIFAGFITGQPIILGAWSKWKKGRIGWMERHRKSSPVLNAIALAGVPMYIIARLTLIILAFFALRNLSQGALVSVEWISFVPHL